MIKKLLAIIISLILIAKDYGYCQASARAGTWSISVLPSSVRLDPSSNRIIDDRVKGSRTRPALFENLLKKNWIYDGHRVKLYAARGEYVSFQLVLYGNNPDSVLKSIRIKMSSFKRSLFEIRSAPELFLEWSVNVSTTSTGYPKASLGRGWYPDALIPFAAIQDDSSQVRGRWIYPLWLPDFNNRIGNQKSLIVWVDQFVPLAGKEAAPGNYSADISVTIAGQTKSIPVDLEIWNFSVPNENKLKASLQEEGFLSSMDEDRELEIYQLCKRNRIALMDPTYKPDLKESQERKTDISWNLFDQRLKKYLTGEAFTKKYGYKDGPGYGEPLETFMLPFDVYGKYGTAGWPDIGKPDVEQNPENKERYIEFIKTVRNHLQQMVNPAKTELMVYLNGLDESYFQEALNRMVYYGNLFHEYYPESIFRIDGGYNEQQMGLVHQSVNAWASHTINYNIDRIRKYQQMGIRDWLYGPLIYESKVNSWVGSLTFTDLPLINQRAISWACWKYHTYSWISWGVGVGWKNAWYDPETWKDVYKAGADSDSTFTYKKLNGNAMLIYSPGIIPGVNQTCPSIRLKAMRDGVQEYEYMRLLSALDKKEDRVNGVVNKIIHEPFGDHSIGNINVWSYDAELWDKARIQLGTYINQMMTK